MMSLKFKHSIIIVWLLLFAINVKSQNGYTIDTRPFADAAHHWYDIFEKENIIVPKKNQAKYKPTDLAEVGENILLYQKNNGGWPKNYDILAVLEPAQKDSLIAAKNLQNTTFDNGTTWTHVECLAQIYTATQIEKFKTACLHGIDFILTAQYGNGGWPQYYPLKKDYSRYITYNDDVFTGIMGMLQRINDKQPHFSFLDDAYQKKLVRAYEKGLDCILNTQINDAGKATAWCQQHDEKTLEPAWARTFEPPSICNGESAEVVLLLMNIKKPSNRIIDAVQNAVAWFETSKILNTKVQTVKAPTDTTKFTISHTDKIVVVDSSARPIWTRYYELKTHRPLFCNRERKIVYSLAEVDRERRDGYAWYTYNPQKVLDKYKKWQQEYATKANMTEK